MTLRERLLALTIELLMIVLGARLGLRVALAVVRLLRRLRRGA